MVDSMKENQHLHDGHRRRLTDKFLKYGESALETHELLELLLGYSIRRRNTNDIAHRLLNEFGNMQDALQGDPLRLESIEGMGPQTVTFFKLLDAVYFRMEHDRRRDHRSRIPFNILPNAGEYLLAHYRNIRTEELTALLLDGSGYLIKFVSLATGSFASICADPRAVAFAAARHNASGVILAHNHPNGDLSPSEEDIRFTRAVEKGLSALGIPLNEHIIVGRETYRPFLYALPFFKEKDELYDL